MKVLLTLTLIIITSAAASAALMPYDYILVRKPSSINQGSLYRVMPTMLSPQLLHDYQALKQEEKPLDISKYVPLNLEPTENSHLVFSKIADRSVQNLMNSKEFKETKIGQTASTVEKNMKQELEFGGEDKESVKHKINFQVQAFQAVAKIEYTGYTNASIIYQAGSSDLGIEVFKKINNKRDLVVSHNIKPDQKISQVSMRWNF